MTNRTDWTDPEQRLEEALADRRCNGCGLPWRLWGPICGGMTTGDSTHYHSESWWRQRYAVGTAQRLARAKGAAS